jgi:hypothetical protein
LEINWRKLWLYIFLNHILECEKIRKNCCRERFHQLKEANLEYSAAMEEMNQELGNSIIEKR